MCICSKQYICYSLSEAVLCSNPFASKSNLTCRFGPHELNLPVAVAVCCQVQCTRPPACCAACCTHCASIHLLITLTMHLWHSQHSSPHGRTGQNSYHTHCGHQLCVITAHKLRAHSAPRKDTGVGLSTCSMMPPLLASTSPVLQHKARQLMVGRQLLQSCLVGGQVGLCSTPPTTCGGGGGGQVGRE